MTAFIVTVAPLVLLGGIMSVIAEFRRNKRGSLCFHVLAYVFVISALIAAIGFVVALL